MSQLKKDWLITPEAFSLLLASLHPNADEAALVYEELRKKLIRFFQASGSLVPEDHTDEVFNRVARRISEGEKLEMDRPSGYFLQTARFVLKEYQRGLRRRFISLDDLTPGAEPYLDPVVLLNNVQERIEKELGLDALQRCRAELEPDECLMIDVYDLGSGRERIERRNLLATKLCKTLNALRIEVSRIKTRLKLCVVRTLGLA